MYAICSSMSIIDFPLLQFYNFKVFLFCGWIRFETSFFGLDGLGHNPFVYFVELVDSAFLLL